MRIALMMTLVAVLAAPLAFVVPARAATDGSSESESSPQSGHQCERRRDTPTS